MIFLKFMNFSFFIVKKLQNENLDLIMTLYNKNLIFKKFKQSSKKNEN